MADLIAQGAELRRRWRRRLPLRRPFLLGRAAGPWSTPWDEHISRRHAKLTWDGAQLLVEKLADACNPIFFGGQQVNRFRVGPGEHFVIGDTTFTVSDERATLSLEAPRPAAERAFSAERLRTLQYRNAAQQMEVLSQLPEVIHGAGDDEELFVRLVSLVLAGAARASAAAVVALRDRGSGDVAAEVLHWDRRDSDRAPFQPSVRLIREAAAAGQSLVHVWAPGESAEAAPGFTRSDDVDWALCTPAPRGEGGGWALYLAGRSAPRDPGEPPDPEELQDEVKFAELVVSTAQALREARMLERRQAGLRSFFSPVVLNAIAEADPDAALAPREADLAVLFCDLRGFSRRSEQWADDLLGLLERVSEALGVMTRHILQRGGVVGDFHGDAAMGFWGWPVAEPDAPLRACQAALAIRAAFAEAARRGRSPLTDFQLGVGVASGKAVAGRIGTVDQVKVTAFGPVVNLAARLEELTKPLRASILIDEATAEAVRRAPDASAWARVRRVARVRPHGMEHAVVVSQLLPPEAEMPELTDQHVAAYEKALEALLKGDWPQSLQWLQQVPAEDEVKDVLTWFITRHGRTPPAGWDGVVELPPAP